MQNNILSFSMKSYIGLHVDCLISFGCFFRTAWAISFCIKQFDCQGLWMQRSVATQVAKSGNDFITGHVWLAHDAYTSKQLLYRLIPKLHVLQHEFARVGKYAFNLKTLSCFTDEDFVGNVCDCASACHHAGSMKNLVYRVIGASYATWSSK